MYRREHPNWLSRTKLSPESIHTNNIIWAQRVIFGNIYVYTNKYIHAKTIYEQRGHGFERDQEGVYGRVWREVREERNGVIKLQSKNKQK